VAHRRDHPDEEIGTVRETVERTGFPLQMRVGEILRSSGWIVYHCCQYFDPEGGKYREMDIVALKTVARVVLHLIIECKKSESQSWVFFAPELGMVQNAASIKHHPYHSAPGNSAYRSLFSGLPCFSRGKPWALYATVIGKDQRNKSQKNKREKDWQFRSALLPVIKATISQIGLVTGRMPVRRIFLPLIVFEGSMFLYQRTGDIQKRDYIVYYHYQPLLVKPEAWPRAPAYIGDALRHYEQQGPGFLVEILAPGELPRWLYEVEDHITTEASERVLDGWGSDPADLKDRILGLVRRQSPDQAHE